MCATKLPGAWPLSEAAIRRSKPRRGAGQKIDPGRYLWIDHLRSADAKLASLLQTDQVTTHPYICLELALGSIASREKVLADLALLPQAPVEAALEIAARYGYHIYDALILAAALEADCELLYTEDMQDGRVIGPLTIRNPFQVA